MVVVTTLDDPADFDFDHESRIAAFGEACLDTAVPCSLFGLCPECEALRRSIERRLRKAYTAGRASAGAADEQVAV